MGKIWARFRDRASRKDEREHFGLAWSVFAAYCVTVSLIIRTLHETGWLVRAVDIVIIVFFVLGAFGVYLAFAVPMRLWPHQPQKRNDAQLEVVEAVFLQGLDLMDNWGRAVKAMSDPISSLRPGYKAEALRTAADMGTAMLGWIGQSEDAVRASLGDDLANRYKMSPDVDREEPAWTEETVYVGMHRNVMCRLGWLRAWSQSQFDL
jgi:hypothetical protein